MIPRTLAPLLARRAKEFPVVFLTGPRQSGKTTLARSTFPDFEYASLEELAPRRLAERNLDPPASPGSHWYQVDGSGYRSPRARPTSLHRTRCRATYPPSIFGLFPGPSSSIGWTRYVAVVAACVAPCGGRGPGPDVASPRWSGPPVAPVSRLTPSPRRSAHPLPSAGTSWR